MQISYGRTAELLEINKYDLIELYGDMGIPCYNVNQGVIGI